MDKKEMIEGLEAIRDSFDINTKYHKFMVQEAINTLITQSEPVAESPACNALLSAAKAGAKWMEWWLDQQECECEGGHFCGRDERMNELRIIKRDIAAFEGR